jgi:hypothetical protein
VIVNHKLGKDSHHKQSNFLQIVSLHLRKKAKKALLEDSPSSSNALFDNMAASTMQAPVWFLDYTKCSLAELRKFIKSRTITKLSTTAHWKLNVQGRLHLVVRLRQMDQDATFTRFMELPPELRVSIFESLLVDKRVWDEENSRSTPRRRRSCTTRTSPISQSRASWKELGGTGAAHGR